MSTQEEYPKTVLIQPTQEYMNHHGYFNDENQSANDIEEYDFVLGTKRKEFIMESKDFTLPQGYELVNKNDDPNDHESE